MAALAGVEGPLICLAGTGRYTVVATEFQEGTWEGAADLAVAGGRAAGEGEPFRRGWIGLIPYDGSVRARVFRVEDPLVWDAALGRVVAGEKKHIFPPPPGVGPPFSPPPSGVPTGFRAPPLGAPTGFRAPPLGAPTGFRAPPPGARGTDLSSPPSGALGGDLSAGTRVGDLAGAPAGTRGGDLAAAPAGAGGAAAPPLELRPTISDAAYEALVTTALGDIRDGRYYQINLLRYFGVSPAPDLGWILRRMARWGGEQAALFRLPDLTVASFSPERFLRLTPSAAGLLAEVRPIKGTAARVPEDPGRDAAAAAALERSAKDRAELSMIIDLMRNDLTRVSLPGTVAVADPGRLVSLAAVHHLEGSVTGRLQPGLRLGELLAALCPAGSITGAPKREVMSAIRAYEGRPRGYFMGHAFYLADDGRFDSSILIRTLVAGADGAFEFAAGSGIVVHSDAAAERREIAAKGRVVTAPS